MLGIPAWCRPLLGGTYSFLKNGGTVRKSTALIMGLVLLSGCGGDSETEGVAGEGVVTVLRGARVIDGNGGPPIENAVLVIRGDRIESIGPAESTEVPDGADVIDVTGKTIMPG